MNPITRTMAPLDLFGEETGFEVVECKSKTLADLILNVHYARRMPPVSYGFLLRIDGVESGCVTFGMPASPNVAMGICNGKYMKNVLELNRLVVKEGCAKFTASRLIAVALKELAKKGDFVIVSYADSQWGHVGKVYQATNWIYTGLTRKRTDPYCGGKHSRHYDRSPEAMKIREVRHPKHRYVMFVGPNRKKMRKDLKWSVEPYPIGDSVRYDVNNPTPVNE